MRRVLVAEIALRNPQAAAQLQASFDAHLTRGRQTSTAAAPITAPAPTPAQPTGALAMELAVFAMAEELDLSPRKLRAALPSLLLRIEAAGYSIDSARREIELRAVTPLHAARREPDAPLEGP